MEKMVVAILFKPKTPDGTVLWVSNKVVSLFMGEESNVDSASLGRLENKLQFFCDGNFRLFMPNAIKLERGKTYGIHVDQFRIVGFFDGGYRNFISIDWFVKKTQRNDRRMNAVYEKVDAIREARLWIRK